MKFSFLINNIIISSLILFLTACGSDSTNEDEKAISSVPAGIYEGTVATTEIIIPSTGMSIDLPNKWEPINKKGFSKIINAIKNEKNFKEVTEALNFDQVNKYAFIKKHGINGVIVNSNLTVVSMFLGEEKINIDDIITEHVNDKKTLPGLINISQDICPKLNKRIYRCLTQNSKRGKRTTKQYHYVTTNNNMYIQFSFNAATKEEINEVEKIITNIKFKKI